MHNNIDSTRSVLRKIYSTNSLSNIRTRNSTKTTVIPLELETFCLGPLWFICPFSKTFFLNNSDCVCQQIFLCLNPNFNLYASGSDWILGDTASPTYRLPVLRPFDTAPSSQQRNTYRPLLLRAFDTASPKFCVLIPPPLGGEAGRRTVSEPLFRTPMRSPRVRTVHVLSQLRVGTGTILISVCKRRSERSPPNRNKTVKTPAKISGILPMISLAFAS